MNVLIYILGTLISYLLGSINGALVVSKILKKDMTKSGSKNLGASNATITLGPVWGIIVGAFDIFKGFIVVFLARMIFPDLSYLPYIVSTAAILGHIFPVFNKFKGGKGFATLMGSILGYNFIVFAIAGALVIIITFVTDYIVIATVTMSIGFPVFVGIYTGNPFFSAILAIASITILIKHSENYVRIFKKEEIGIRSALSKKHRI